MANVYDYAHQLAKALAASKEYQEFKKAQHQLEANPGNKKLVMDLRNKQMDLQKDLLMGKNVDETKKKQLEKMQKALALNPAIAQFLQIEYRFSTIMMDIQKIIGDAVGFK